MHVTDLFDLDAHRRGHEEVGWGTSLQGMKPNEAWLDMSVCDLSNPELKSWTQGPIPLHMIAKSWIVSVVSFFVPRTLNPKP